MKELFWLGGVSLQLWGRLAAVAAAGGSLCAADNPKISLVQLMGSTASAAFPEEGIFHFNH